MNFDSVHQKKKRETDDIQLISSGISEDYKGPFHRDHLPATIGMMGFIVCFSLMSLQIGLSPFIRIKEPNPKNLEVMVLEGDQEPELPPSVPNYEYSCVKIKVTDFMGREISEEVFNQETQRNEIRLNRSIVVGEVLELEADTNYEGNLVFQFLDENNSSVAWQRIGGLVDGSKTKSIKWTVPQPHSGGDYLRLGVNMVDNNCSEICAAGGNLCSLNTASGACPYIDSDVDSDTCLGLGEQDDCRNSCSINTISTKYPSSDAFPRVSFSINPDIRTMDIGESLDFNITSSDAVNDGFGYVMVNDNNERISGWFLIGESCDRNNEVSNCTRTFTPTEPGRYEIVGNVFDLNGRWYSNNRAIDGSRQYSNDYIFIDVADSGGSATFSMSPDVREISIGESIDLNLITTGNWITNGFGYVMIEDIADDNNRGDNPWVLIEDRVCTEDERNNCSRTFAPTQVGRYEIVGNAKDAQGNFKSNNRGAGSDDERYSNDYIFVDVVDSGSQNIYDLNEDGSVNNVDLILFINNYFRENVNGKLLDFDSNGDVDLWDYKLLKENLE